MVADFLVDFTFFHEMLFFQGKSVVADLGRCGRKSGDAFKTNEIIILCGWAFFGSSCVFSPKCLFPKENGGLGNVANVVRDSCFLHVVGYFVLKPTKYCFFVLFSKASAPASDHGLHASLHVSKQVLYVSWGGAQK